MPYTSLPAHAVALSLCVSRCLCYSVPYLAAARLAPLRSALPLLNGSNLCCALAVQGAASPLLCSAISTLPLLSCASLFITFALLSSTQPLLFCAIRPVLFPTSPLQFLSIPGLAFASRGASSPCLCLSFLSNAFATHCLSLQYRCSALFAVQCLSFTLPSMHRSAVPLLHSAFLSHAFALRGPAPPGFSLPLLTFAYLNVAVA